MQLKGENGSIGVIVVNRMKRLKIHKPDALQTFLRKLSVYKMKHLKINILEVIQTFFRSLIANNMS